MGLIITGSIITGLFFALIVYLAVKAQKGKKVTGEFSIVGSAGIAKTAIKPGEPGKVHVFGEIWQAESDEDIMKNDKVTVVSVNDFTIKVKKV